MNRLEIKRNARELIKGHLWELVSPYALISLIIILVNILVIKNLPGGEYNSWGIILDILLFPLVLGTTAYVLNFIRREPYELKAIFNYYNIFLAAVALYMLQFIFAFAWALLLIIPGIIAAISYTMAPYIMIDGEADPLECIRKSKKMMYGYKWDFIVFLLSFFGWLILGALTLGIAFIYVIPYLMVSEALYYEELKKITKFD